MSRKLWAVLGDAATKDSPPADRENKNGHPPLDVASDILPLPVHDPTCGVSVGIRFYFASIAFDYLHAYYSGDAPFLFLFFFFLFLLVLHISESELLSKLGWVVGVGCGLLQSRSSVD
jgi:hypothetical protein